MMSGFNQLSEWMAVLGMKTKESNKYASALCEEGYDTVKAIAQLDADKLKDIGIKKAHANLILTEAQAASGGDVEEESAPVEVAPVAEMEYDDEFFSKGKIEKPTKKNKKPNKIGDKKQSKGSRTGQGSSCRR